VELGVAMRASPRPLGTPSPLLPQMADHGADHVGVVVGPHPLAGIEPDSAQLPLLTSVAKSASARAAATTAEAYR